MDGREVTMSPAAPAHASVDARTDVSVARARTGQLSATAGSTLAIADLDRSSGSRRRDFMKDRGRVLWLAAACIAVFASALAIADEGDWKAPARASKKKNPIAADATSIAAGKEIYKAQCLSCHGPEGKGDGPNAANLEKRPGNLSDGERMGAQTDGALFWKITEGRKPMPTFEKLLTEEERWKVINFVRTLAPKTGEKPGGGS
jgi:mono/diheme cytochrome c family protein